MNRSTPTANTRAAHAALARRPASELEFDRMLLVDDSDEDVTQIITVVTERICAERNNLLEVQS
jgi:hypothetical protein